MKKIKKIPIHLRVLTTFDCRHLPLAPTLNLPSPVHTSAPATQQSLAAFLRVPDVMPLVEAAGCLFYHSRPSRVAPIPSRGPGPDTSLTEDGTPGSRQPKHDAKTKRGARRPRALAGRLTTGGNDQRDVGGGRLALIGEAGTPVEGCWGRDGGGGGGAGLSREDVTYVATTLQLRKA